MVSSDIESTDLFDFGKVCVDIDSQERKEEYYRGLLEARDIAEKALARTLSDASQDQIRSSLDDQLRHESVTGAPRLFLDAWVRRGRHFKTKVVPAMVLSTLALVGYVGKGAYENHRMVVAERSAERSVQELAGEHEKVVANIRSLAQDSAIARLPTIEHDSFVRDISAARNALAGADAFFGQYSSVREIEQRITPSNQADILAQARRYADSFTQAQQRIASASVVLKRQTELERLDGELVPYKGAIGSWEGPSVFKERANASLSSAVSALERRDQDAARAAIDALAQTDRARNEFGSLRDRVNGLYASIEDAGCPSDAIVPAKELYRTFTSAVAGADIDGMSHAAQRLEGFSQQLLSTYELRVVGGIWIYQIRDPSKNSYYLKVQAIDGQPLWLPMQDDDRGGIVSSTPMWGEAVPEEVYQAVGRDKKDNGIIDNAIMGGKKRCTLSPTYAYRVQLPSGQEFALTASRSRITPVRPKGDLSQESSWRD